MPKKTYYITTTLPYVNAEPHIGFALEIVTADVIARYQRLIGKKVLFNTGVDEHGQKIYQEAIDSNLDPQKYCDTYAEKFKILKQTLNLNFDLFVRTTDSNHKQAAQEFWKRCFDNGDIYKAQYKLKYCVGCEMEKTDSELENNRCPLHPNKDLEEREEENYFFRFSKYQNQLLSLYKSNPNFVMPNSKMREITSFVKMGLKDFSISRLKEKMPWGIPVPNDKKHVMYVWFDALINYISTINWPNDEIKFKKYWPGVQIAGKDNLRQQSAMWQAMLMSAKLPSSKQILINGFISIDGQKMSKSIGNVIHPQEMVDKYGIDASRFLIVGLGPIGEDINVNWSKFDQKYTAFLTNGYGNLCSRIAKLCENASYAHSDYNPKFSEKFVLLMNNYEIQQIFQFIWKLIQETDLYLANTKPWKLKGDAQKTILSESVKRILDISWYLQIIMPETANKILEHFGSNRITALKPIFPRLKA